METRGLVGVVVGAKVNGGIDVVVGDVGLGGADVVAGVEVAGSAFSVGVSGGTRVVGSGSAGVGLCMVSVVGGSVRAAGAAGTLLVQELKTRTPDTMQSRVIRRPFFMFALPYLKKKVTSTFIRST